MAEYAPGLDRIRAQLRAHRALLDDLQRRGQRAGAQQDRQIVGVLRGEPAPVIWPDPPRIGVSMIGRGDHLLVQHDGEAVPDILLGDVAELLGAHAVEAEIHVRLAGLRIETRRWHRSAGRPTPARGAPPRPRGRQRPCCRLLHRQDFVADRRDTCGQSGSACSSTSWKVILAVLPRMVLSWVGSCRPGTCTRMRSSPCALDVGLARAQFVDAPAHHFDGLVHHLLAGQRSCRRRSSAG